MLRGHAFSLSLALTHTHTRRHATVILSRTRASTGRSSRHFFPRRPRHDLPCPSNSCRRRRHPPWTTSGRAIAARRRSSRVGLPRLFKFPLTVCRPASTRGGTGGSQRRRPRYVEDGSWRRPVDPVLHSRVYSRRDADVTDPLLLPPSTKLRQNGGPRTADHVIRRDVLMTYRVPCVKGPAKRPVMLVARSSRDRAHVRVQ